MKKNQTKKHVSRTSFSKWRLIQLSLFPKLGQIPHTPFFKGRIRGIFLKQITPFILLFALTSGCGYSTKSLISRKINSIYIPIFENVTFRRGLEFDLTKAVKDEIMSKTTLRIAQKDGADTILNGKISNVTEGIITQDITDNIVESRVTIYVDIELVDRRTGRALINESGITQSAEFIVKRGETLESATDEGFVGLAEAIVSHLEEKW